ncbi:5-methylcytosine restriction system specificity protein McrC [Streptomyces xiamenensis]|uniref:5-methylcytosine restriction system specificity protein McrC n=1 Tax=Streptomyces xiamenensis TaxID=408015 RepID=UPI00062897C0|nr:hypothetical protein [Streptomyces xiamenensis]
MTRGPVPHEVTLTEHSSVTIPHDRLSAGDLDTLRAMKPVTLTDRRAGYDIRAQALTGVLQLSRIRLVIRPKLPIAGNRLIDWLCYADNQREPDESLRNWPLGRDGYAGLVPAALLHECRLLLRRGLRREYVRRHRVDTTLRGRLDVEAQATRRFGAVDQLHLQTFEYEDGGWENLVCGAALTVAASRSTDSGQARLLHEVSAHFPSPRQPLDALPLLARARYNRLNDHYRAAHAWARMVLGGGGATDLLEPYGFGAKNLLLNLNVLWERVVRRMAVEAASGMGGRGTLHGEGHIRTLGMRKAKNTPLFRPDVLLAFPQGSGTSTATRFLAIDAKYKRYGEEDVSSTDRHQLLTYIAGYTGAENPLALIVYPSPAGPDHHVLRIEGPRGHLGRIEVLGIDTRVAPQDAVDPLRKVIAGFAGSAVTT